MGRQISRRGSMSYAPTPYPYSDPGVYGAGDNMMMAEVCLTFLRRTLPLHADDFSTVRTAVISHVWTADSRYAYAG